jgi:hypothetical protein
MYIVPSGFLWFFLIGGILLIGYSFFPRENRSAGFAFVFGLISVGIAIFLWLSPSVILK